MVLLWMSNWSSGLWKPTLNVTAIKGEQEMHSLTYRRCVYTIQRKHGFQVTVSRS